MDTRFSFSQLVEYLMSDNLIEAVEVGEDFEIEGFCALHDTQPGKMTWSRTGEADWPKVQAPVVILPADSSIPDVSGIHFVYSKHPRKAFIKAMHEFLPKERPTGVSKTVVIGRNCNIGKDVYIGHFSVIADNVDIGDGSLIYPNVVIYENVKIGKNCVVHSGTVIGSVGFGYERIGDENLQFPHIGGIIIEDDVEIGSLNNIERGTLSNTVIKKGAKIDDLCSIGHNVVIEEGCNVVGGALVFGSTVLKRGCYIAPGAMVREYLVIGENATVGMGAVVVRSVEPGDTVAGVPAKSLKKPMQGERS